jgi:hypothetical protein
LDALIEVSASATVVERDPLMFQVSMKPKYHKYYGKYSIDVSRKMTNRDSGLNKNDDINGAKVSKMLRAIHCVVKNDFK